VAYPIVVNETLDSLARPRQGEQKKVWRNRIGWICTENSPLVFAGRQLVAQELLHSIFWVQFPTSTSGCWFQRGWILEVNVSFERYNIPDYFEL
jgi:hypothetical protein